MNTYTSLANSLLAGILIVNVLNVKVKLLLVAMLEEGFLGECIDTSTTDNRKITIAIGEKPEGARKRRRRLISESKKQSQSYRQTNFHSG